MYAAKILKDSTNKHDVRLTTFEITFPRIVLAEFNTHRTFSRNSASSRAIPVEKMLQKVVDDPFTPVYWGKNQKGMQAEVELTEPEQNKALVKWLKARDMSVTRAKQLLKLGIHKQITNRLLEPWLWHTVIVTATEYDNFWGLRCNKDAQPEIRVIAEMMRDVYDKSQPTYLADDQWHLPLIADDEQWPEHFTIDDLIKVSVGRCARVSYLTHDGKRDPQADIELYHRLASAGHMSPFEHVARPMTDADAQQIVENQVIIEGAFTTKYVCKNIFSGNFRSWVSHRKTIPGEAVYTKKVQ